MQNAYNLNLHLAGQDSAATQSALLDVLRDLFRSDGWIEAPDENTAERTLVVARLSDAPWLTIFDDGPVEELEGLAELITQQMGSSIVSMLEHDGDVWHLYLYRGGRAVDKLNAREDGEYAITPIEPDLKQWSQVLGKNRCDEFKTSLNQDPGRLNPATDVLGIGPSLYHEIDDLSEDEFPAMARLRLIRPKSREKPTRKPASTKTPQTPEPPFAAKMIPELLIGKPAEVKRRWKKIVKKVAQTGDWSQALAGVEHIEIEDVSSMLSDPPIPYEGDSIDRALLYVVEELLMEELLGDKKDRETFWKLILSGMDRPWFCLAMVASYPKPHAKFSEQPFAATAIRKMLRWWPELVAWDERLDVAIHTHVERRYPRVYFPMVNWLEGLGYDRESQLRPLFDMDPDDAVMQILKWLKDSGF